MDDGLVCESYGSDEDYRVFVFDPVAMTMRTLPAVGGNVFWQHWDIPPAIVTVVDNVGFKVILLCRTEELRTRFVLYESSTDAWRDLGNRVEGLGVPVIDGIRYAESAVYFQGTFYATFFIHSAVLLLSYNLEESCWKRVLAVESPYPGYLELIVFNNRMFITTWLDDEPHGSLRRTKVRRVNYSKRLTFEIREILGNSSNSIVKIPCLELQRIFYGEENKLGLEMQDDIACGFPINSDSVVLVSRYTGKLIIYNVISGRICELPAHPLRQASLELAKEEGLSVSFHAKLMKLSLKNILANSATQLPPCVQDFRPYS